MLHTLYTGASSVCLELENHKPYEAPASFTVSLNGQVVCTCAVNVFSLYDLQPDTDYTVCVQGDGIQGEIVLHTRAGQQAVNIQQFGAVGDGVTDDTVAIQTAIDQLPPHTRLLFPPGTYLTRPLTLKSHMSLELQSGAKLLGAPDRAQYPIVPGIVQSQDGEPIYLAGFEGEAVPMYQSLLTASYAEDIEIIGPGCVDGNAQQSDFWTDFESFPVARPRLAFFNRCKHIILHGVHLCNSPSWQIHPYYSEHVGIYNVRVSAPKVSPNTDACDPESCDYVDMIGCHFTVGDDCIAIKSGKRTLGETLQCSANHHTIRNCLMEYGHGAVTLGSEIGAGVQNLCVEQCLFRGTDRGLRIKTRRGRGKNCVVDGVLFENIRMEGVITPIVINMWYNHCDPDSESEYVWSRETLPVDERTPHLGKFHFKDLDCQDAQAAACYIDGLPEAPIDAVTFENVHIQFAHDAKPDIPAMQSFIQPTCRLGLYLSNVQEVSLENVTLDGVQGAPLITAHCGHIQNHHLNIKNNSIQHNNNKLNNKEAAGET